MKAVWVKISIFKPIKLSLTFILFSIFYSLTPKCLVFSKFTVFCYWFRSVSPAFHKIHGSFCRKSTVIMIGIYFYWFRIFFALKATLSESCIHGLFFLNFSSLHHRTVYREAIAFIFWILMTKKSVKMNH